MPAPKLTPMFVAVALAVAGCGDDEKTTTPAAERTSTTQTASTPSAASKTDLPRPTLRLGRSKTYVARLTTNFGEIDIRLDVRRAPKTSASFVYLARRGFFDGLTFHRIARSPGGGDFVIQGGDPLGTGQGGPGYSVVEAPPRSLRYTRGIVAMAKTQVEAPGTSGSQFFIVTAEDAPLPAEYALLGRVVKGMNAVTAIAAQPTDPQTEQPRRKVEIRQVKIVTR